MASETEWLLFLDESGDFSDPVASVCIAGFLLRAEEKGGEDLWLRGLLARRFPEVEYPPHARFLNRDAFHLANWLLRDRPDIPGVSRDSLERLAALLCEKSASRAAMACRGAIDAGKVPRWEDLAELEPELQGALPTEFQTLRGLVDRSRAAIVAVLEEVRARYGDERVFAVAGADTRIREADDGPVRDRYLALLEVVFERVLALFRKEPPERHKIWVRAAERHVSLPWGLTLHLRHFDVGQAVRAAERRPPLALSPGVGADPHVRLVPMEPPRFDGDVHPGVVIADFLANRMREPLGASSPWREVREAAGGRVALPVETPPRMYPDVSLPTVAADGLPRRAIAAAFEGREPVGLEGARGWAKEQAARWVEAINGEGARR
jgi:hypothetical protein